MSAREWEPGDVALLTFSDGSTAVGVRRTDGAWGHCGGFGNGSAYDCIGGFTARPFVVIDPESDEDVERLIRVQDKAFEPDLEPREDWETAIPTMQAALRQFVNPTPPKPAEPTGLGAVVECDPGPVYEKAWAVRVWADDDFGGKAWDYYDSSGNGGRVHYADLAVVRILSEGVQS